MANAIVRSEDDAYALLEQYLKGKNIPATLDLRGWPRVAIRVTGEKFDQSITPRAMKGLIELQEMIYRSYALARYGVPDVRKLSNEERDELEIVVKVESGSSNFEIDLQGLLEHLIDVVGGKMEPVHVLVVVLGIGLLWAGQSSYRSYLASRQKIRKRELQSEERIAEIESQKFASAQETERAKIMKELIRREPILDNVDRQAFDARTALLRQLGNADSFSFQGVEVDGSVAQELARNARRKSEETRLDGRYRIERVDSSDLAVFKVRVVRMGGDPQLRFDAMVSDDQLTHKNKAALQQAEWNHKQVDLKINARLSDTNIVSDAVILDVSPVSDRGGLASVD